MQIIIPMSGFGERFRRAGYEVPKPLIRVDGKPVIAHVVDMFPGETDFLFICNADHLTAPQYRMEEVLRTHCPTGRIVAVTPHKLGPVHAVLQARDAIDPDAPAIVNYCDFTCYWDYADFRRFVGETRCDGAIPAYRGFHPHSLGSTFYAYMREKDGWVLDIQEKQPFTDNPMNEYASSGTYYFRSGRLMLDAFAAQCAQDLTVSGEFYASLAYQPLFRQKKAIAVYELQHFMQWGTPQDLEEYVQWSNAFRRLAAPCAARARHAGTVLIPAAGLGSRFAGAGYDRPKPLIPVSSRPMLMQALADLPEAPRARVVLRRDAPGAAALEEGLREWMPHIEVLWIEGVTDGQARTCVLGLEGLDDAAPLTIGACDNGLLYDAARFLALFDDREADVVVWGVRGYARARLRPEHFGWIDADATGRVRGVSVKKPLADPAGDPVITGTFTFRRAGDFRRAAGRLFARGGRVNGEFYVDSLIDDAVALGLDCRLFEVDHYLGWGTPDELRTFEYWQSCFHKWPSHPYSLDDDADVSAAARTELDRRARNFRPLRPAPRKETARAVADAG